MKKLGFLFIILSLTIIFGACPPLLEDDAGGSSGGDIITFDDSFELDVYKWFEILDKIAKDKKFVSLDLTKGTYKYGNMGGGLVKKDPDDLSEPVAFDPFPASSSGKDFILSITLPEAALIIKESKPDGELAGINDEKIKDAKNYSAFRSFTHLRSVTAANVTLIGNFAFADCTALTEVKFPRVSSTAGAADIGKYAFLGCTGLKEIKFNTAAIIGECAFKDCTSLSKMDFPKVWKIEKNAFEGCKSLVNVFFEEATKISDEAFKNCTGLKKAEFNVNPERDPHDAGNPPNLVIDPDDPDYDYDSVIFYPSVFNGCKALEVLNVRNAWNVYFAKDVLANTGTSIEIYLLDVQYDDNDSFGHPQNVKFLGEGVTNTLKKVNIIVPALDHPENTKIYGNKGPDNTDNVAIYLKTNYPTGVVVTVIPK
jgi:hypothetical protein